MLRITIILLLLITFAVPLLSKAKDYWDEKSLKIKQLENEAKRAIGKK